MSFYECLTANSNKVLYDVSFKNVTCDSITGQIYYLQKNINSLAVPTNSNSDLICVGGIGHITDFPNGTQFTCPSDGVYEFNLNILYNFLNGNVSLNSCQFIVNGLPSYFTNVDPTQNNLTLSIMFQLNVNDTVSIRIYNSDGALPLDIAYGVVSIKRISNIYTNVIPPPPPPP